MPHYTALRKCPHPKSIATYVTSGLGVGPVSASRTLILPLGTDARCGVNGSMQTVQRSGSGIMLTTETTRWTAAALRNSMSRWEGIGSRRHVHRENAREREKERERERTWEGQRWAERWGMRETCHCISCVDRNKADSATTSVYIYEYRYAWSFELERLSLVSLCFKFVGSTPLVPHGPHVIQRLDTQCRSGFNVATVTSNDMHRWAMPGDNRERLGCMGL